MVDTMATRYGLLPSEVLARADSIDVLFMDTAMQFQTAKQKEAQAKAEGKPRPADNIPEETLMAAMQRVRGAQNPDSAK